jgi:hypothetical protein
MIADWTNQRLADLSCLVRRVSAILVKMEIGLAGIGKGVYGVIAVQADS